MSPPGVRGSTLRHDRGRPEPSRGATRSPRALLAIAALWCASCGTPLLKLPSGPGTLVSASDAAAALAKATSGCASVRTLTAEIAVSGSAGGHRLRGRLAAGVATPASVLLEAAAPFGSPLFIFVATGNDATLLLPRDDRVLEHGRPDAVLEAVAGVPLGAADLTTTLTGCPTIDSGTGGRQFGDTWLVIGDANGDSVYLQRSAAGASWRLVASVRRTADATRRWRAEYGDRQNEIPRSIRVMSVDADGKTGRTFDLQLALSQVEVNVPLGSDVFKVQIPRRAVPITLDELRRNGPLGNAR